MIARFIFPMTMLAATSMTVQAQLLPDPLDTRPRDVELRARIVPLLPAIRNGLRGDNVDAQRAGLAVIADVPPRILAEGNIGPALTDFLLKDRDDAALTSIGLRVFGNSFPDPADIVKVIAKHGKSKDITIRRATGAALASVVTNATPPGRSLQNATYFIDTARNALPQIAIALEDADGVTQRGGVLALEAIARVTTGLYTFDNDLAIEEPKPPVVGNRFIALATLLRAIAASVPKLGVALTSTEAETRTAAATTLESLAVLRRVVISVKGPADLDRIDILVPSWPTLGPVIKGRIQDESHPVRLALAEALEMIPDHPEARSILRTAANDRSIPVRWTTARGLGRAISDKPNEAATADDVATLGKLVGDSDTDVRMVALASLTRLGTNAAAAGPAVIAAAKKGDTEPRIAAVKAITALKLRADQSLAVLIDGVNDPDVRLRREAAAAMIRFGPQARAALPALRKAVASPDPALRLTAAEVIFAIDQKPRLKDL